MRFPLFARIAGSAPTWPLPTPASHPFRDAAYVAQYSAVVRSGAFDADDALCVVGFGLHVADVYLSELLKASAAAQRPVPAAQTLVLLQPFVAVLASTQQPALVMRIRCV